MLLVAQRVISTTRRVQGVNVYRYRHSRLGWPADPRVMLDEPGKTLEKKDVSLRPGRNRIVSFLDVVAPDDAMPGEILGELRQLRAQAPPPELPAERVLGRCAVRWGLEERMLPFWRGELEDLIQHLIGIVA
jgi:hypothetical protein